MSQYSAGTVSTTAGSPTVIGVDVEWSLVAPGNLVVIGTDTIPFTIATVDAGASTITLTANYPSTLSGAPYVISRDFTPAFSLPLMNQGDVLTTFIFNEAMRLISAQLQLGWIPEGAFADAATRNAAVPSPIEGRSYAYTEDDSLVHLYIGGAWRPWEIAGITAGPDGLPGFTPEPDFVDTTKLRFTVQGGGYTTPVELKGEKGDDGGLTFKGGWSAVTTYFPDDIVTEGTGVYVSLIENTNFLPSANPAKWTLLFEQFGTGEASVVVGTFVDADLDGNDALAINHGIGTQAVSVKIFNDNWEEIGPDNITATSSTVVTVALADFVLLAPLSGTWRYLVTSKTP